MLGLGWEKSGSLIKVKAPLQQVYAPQVTKTHLILLNQTVPREVYLLKSLLFHSSSPLKAAVYIFFL
jgi:hypothetical protein